MNGFGLNTLRGRGNRAIAVMLLLSAMFVGVAGASCSDVPFSSATFRDAAMTQIGAGIKSVLDGLLDGVFAVISEAGQGGSGASTST